MPSAGYIGWRYTMYGIAHSTRVRLVEGVDPTDAGVMGPDAETHASALAAILSDEGAVLSWYTQGPTGILLLDVPLDAPFPGEQSDLGPTTAFRSLTWTFTGKGPPPSNIEPGGQALSRIFIGRWYNPVPGEKYVVLGAYLGTSLYAASLETSGLFWADYSGSKANVRNNIAVQMNAYAQRKHGT